MPALLRAALLLRCAASAAAAQPAAPHTVPGTIAQRAQACTICHGREGRATNDAYIPRIAGKPAGDLLNQLVHFRDGRRQNATMAHLVDLLSDDGLREMAGDFASLDLPYPPPHTSSAPAERLQQGEAPARRGDLAVGAAGGRRQARRHAARAAAARSTWGAGAMRSALRAAAFALFALLQAAALATWLNLCGEAPVHAQPFAATLAQVARGAYLARAGLALPASLRVAERPMRAADRSAAAAPRRRGLRGALRRLPRQVGRGRLRR
jgi:cytochrome c553